MAEDTSAIGAAGSRRCAVRGHDDLAGLNGESQHQPLLGDARAGGRAGVETLEQICCLEQLVVADLDGTPHLVEVVSGGRLDEAGVQSGETLQVAAGNPDTRV
ncbi:hypothetical protein [Streptomyces sp. SID2888]|uniref:hypothetical protein n=1 Tax=Streptomyces sp. SID2888 TaxID=2690256 RepID=UPI0013716171|nr:hypothetical protein [Streptomyces sp. SID2888]MYV46707.1 hypothetical protein [Streptomyces sp. SID2888]